MNNNHDTEKLALKTQLDTLQKEFDTKLESLIERNELEALNSKHQEEVTQLTTKIEFHQSEESKLIQSIKELESNLHLTVLILNYFI